MALSARGSGCDRGALFDRMYVRERSVSVSMLNEREMREITQLEIDHLITFWISVEFNFTSRFFLRSRRVEAAEQRALPCANKPMMCSSSSRSSRLSR